MISINGKPVTFNGKAVAEFLFDAAGTLIAGGIVWGIMVKPDVDLSEQWFGVATSIAVAYGVAKLLSAHKLINK